MTLTALMLNKGRPHPPQLSVAVSLAQIGYRVSYTSSTCSVETRRYLEGHNVDVTELQPQASTPTHLLGKAAYWWDFRRKAWDLIERRAADLLWIGSADTALALGRGLLRHQFVLQLLELYDNVPFYRKHLRDYARSARAVVVPEANRAAIFRSWYALSRTPFVLPNKPLEHPRRRCLPIGNEQARALLATVPAGTRLVMYQGIVHSDRDIRPVGRAVSALGPAWKFVVVGDDQGFLAPLKNACPDLLYVPYVSPPYHLEVTSHATIGVLAYCFDNLNNVFCAPNKVWEYAGFGLPMLGNDVPGLRLLEEHGAGLCADFQNVAAVERALQDLVRKQDRFAAASVALFDRFELGDLVREIAAAA
jgi:glycosyltransferase involved in cell wall biosynthesis